MREEVNTLFKMKLDQITYEGGSSYESSSGNLQVDLNYMTEEGGSS